MPQQYEDWHWWCASAGGRLVALEEFEKLPLAIQGELLTIMTAWLDGKTGPKEIGSLGSGLLELRFRAGNNHYRVLFHVVGSTCVALHCFYKNQQKCPKVKVDLARGRMRKGAHRPCP